MKPRLFRHEVLPFVLSFVALVGLTLAGDALLHHFELVWVGRWLGIPGTFLILGSFGYSLRKRKWTTQGHPATLLRRHEWMAWSGAWLVLLHAGVHFNAILPWLAVLAMLVNVASGLTGKFLLDGSRRRLEAARDELRQRGLNPGQADDHIWWDSLTYDAVRQWRAVHFPITLAFAVLALAHLLAVFLFWGWR